MSGTIPVIMFLLIATGGALAADSRVDDALFLAARKALPQAMMPTCSQRVALLLHSGISSCGDKKGGRTSITLKIGVGFCFRRHYPLVVDLVKGAWAQYVRRFNAGRLAEKTDLHEFLFGSDRANLDVVRPIVREFQSGRCFYCRKPLNSEAGQVDHFIPWSRYPVDLGHNFVLAHASCNGAKGSMLAAEEHLGRWVERNRAHALVIAEACCRAGMVHDLPASQQIAAWAYQQAAATG